MGLLVASSSWAVGAEPFGAEDYGAQQHRPSIPEPMIFDLVRGLGARRGEVEVNTLGMFPFGSSEPSSSSGDAFGFSPASNDRGGIEWAPEIEIALADGFAVEFELPFEGSQLEAYKFAAQWTFGTGLEDRFIHGSQVIVEPTKDFDAWDLTFLYLAGVQINERWSVLGMAGVRPEIVKGQANHTDGLMNVTVFRDLDNLTTLGLETDFTFGEADRTSLLLMPQVDRELTDHFELQFGAGVGFIEDQQVPLSALRLIYSH